MKTPFILLGAASTLLLLTGCASSDLSVRSEFQGSPPVLSNTLVREHAEAIIQANPEVPDSTAHAIAKRRFGGPDKPGKKELKKRAARDEFREDLVDVLGTP